MTGPMTPEREASLRAEHQRERVTLKREAREAEPGHVDICQACAQFWPCDATELLDALAAERVTRA